MTYDVTNWEEIFFWGAGRTKNGVSFPKKFFQRSDIHHWKALSKTRLFHVLKFGNDPYPGRYSALSENIFWGDSWPYDHLSRDHFLMVIFEFYVRKYIARVQNFNWCCHLKEHASHIPYKLILPVSRDSLAIYRDGHLIF